MSSEANNNDLNVPKSLLQPEEATGNSAAPASREQPSLPEPANPDETELDLDRPVETEPAADGETETVVSSSDPVLEADHASGTDQASADHGDGQVAKSKATQSPGPLQAGRKTKDPVPAKPPAKSSRTKSSKAPAVPAAEPDDPAGFPIDVFPESLQGYLREVASSIGCPPDYVGVSMLTVAGSAIGNSRALKLKPSWFVSPRLYMANVGSPGSGKSPALDQVRKPLNTGTTRAADKDRAEHDKPEKESVDETASEAPSQPNGTDRTDDPRRLAAELDKRLPKVTVESDVTKEALIEDLAANDRAVLLIADELVGWVKNMNAYRGGRGDDREFFQSCWSGSRVTNKRKKEGRIVVDRPFLSVLGGIQPDLLEGLVAKRRPADGFIDRILFAYPPEPPVRTWSKGVEPATEKIWEDTVHGLFELEMETDSATLTRGPRIERWTARAEAIWESWFNANAAETIAEAFPRSLKGPWDKMPSNAARLILIVHFLRLVSGEVGSEEVDEESVRRGIRLANYFKAHARRVRRQLESTHEDARTLRVIAWIKKKGGQCTARDLLHNNVGGVKKQSEAQRLIRDLVDRGFGEVREEKADNNLLVVRFTMNR